MSVCRQCELLGLARATYYYRSRTISDFNFTLMRLIDEQFTRTPFYGVPRMTAWLRRQGYHVNAKRIRRLMRLMGLEAIYPKPRLSQRSKEHKIYPYLLKGVCVDKADQVWGADITYIRLAYGFIYLVAIMDWFSRYVLAWQLSNTLDKEFCLEALNKALMISKPEIFNTDQGSQFTSRQFTGCLEKSGILISMDGRGRVFDNIFVERLWRTLKYEEVYIHNYQSVRDVRIGIGKYFQFYNTERLHSALGYQPPWELYVKERVRTKTVQTTQLMHLKQCHLLS